MTKMLPAEFTVQDDFPPVDYNQWRSLVEQTLAGAPFERKLVKRTYDSLDVQPIYGRGDELAGEDPLGFPGLPPFVRGSRSLGAAKTGWDLRQEFAHPDLCETNRAILEDLRGGVTSLHLRLDMAARGGLDPDHQVAEDLAGHDGIMAYSVDDFDAALADVPLNSVPVAIDAGAAFLPAAAMLAGLWQRRDVAAAEALGAFHADPLAALARAGNLPMPATDALASLASLAKWTAENFPRVTAIGVDTSPYHDAGATASQDIAFAVATAVEYLRAMTGAGLSIDTAAQQIVFRFGLGTHHFRAIAKLRAARQVWSRVVEASGGARQSQAMKIHARTGNRVLTQYDPYVNLLRNAVAVFAAGLGGADTITSVPLDAMTGLPDSFSRRVARNTVLVLQDESHLNRVVDPAGGSWFLDQLTEELANKAWEIFQETERQGGMLSRTSWRMGVRSNRAGLFAASQKYRLPQGRHHRDQRVRRPQPATDFALVTGPLCPSQGSHGAGQQFAQLRPQRSRGVGLGSSRGVDCRNPGCDGGSDRGRTWFPSGRLGQRIIDGNPAASLRRAVRKVAPRLRRLAGKSRSATAGLPGQLRPACPSHWTCNLVNELF